MIADAALFGWTRNYNKVIYDREAAFCSKAKSVVNEIKKKSMLKSNDINKISLEYIVVNANTHIAEIIIETNDDFDIMD